MARTGARTQKNPRPGPLRRFCCPVETCRRLLKSQSGWTRHIHSVHANIDSAFYEDQDPEVVMNNHDPRVGNCPPLASPCSSGGPAAPSSLSPTMFSPPVPNDSNNCEDPTGAYEGGAYQFSPDSRSSSSEPSTGSSSNNEHLREYHHLINGDIFLLIDGMSV
jgi:hypothetical protein